MPEEERYDGYLQLENGVGMLRLLDNEVAGSRMPSRDGDDRNMIMLPLRQENWQHPYIERMSGNDSRRNIRRSHMRCIAIRNDFFGEKITVSGLITGQDLTEQLRKNSLGDRLLIPCNMLRSGENVFLDDITVDEVPRSFTSKDYHCRIKRQDADLCISSAGFDTENRKTDKETNV